MKSLIYLCIGVVGVTLACTDKSVGSDVAQAEEQRQSQARESKRLKQAQESAPLEFGAEQNDPDGYDGIPWSSEPAASVGQHSEGAFGTSPLLNKIVSAPGQAQRLGEYRGDPNGELFFLVDKGTYTGTPKLDHGIQPNVKTNGEFSESLSGLGLRRRQPLGIGICFWF
jgi:hypothetical protein